MELNKQNIKSELRRFIIVTLNIIIVSTFINLLSYQFKLVPGGVVGYALFINLLTQIPVGTIAFVINTIALAILFLVSGKGPGIKGIYGYIFFSICIDLTRSFLNISQVELSDFGQQLFYMSILGVLMPFSMAVILRCKDYSIGGYSTIYLIVKRFVNIKPQVLFFMLDATVATGTALAFGVHKGLLIFIQITISYYVMKYTMKLFDKYNIKF